MQIINKITKIIRKMSLKKMVKKVKRKRILNK